MTDSAVVDTNILINAANHGPDNMDAMYILVRLMKDDLFALAIDSQHRILDEYRENLKQCNTKFSKTIQKYIQKQVYEVQGEEAIAVHVPISEDRVSDLDKMGFHSKDLKFVRIAPRTGMEIIASCDKRSFLNDKYRNWIESELDVDVLGMSEFKERIDDQ